LSIEAVVFDLGGVVFRHDPARRWDEFARLADTTAGTVRKRLQDSGYSRACDLGSLNLERAHAEGVRLLGRRLSLTHFADVWVRAFEPDPEVVALARRLKSRCAVAALSNNSAIVRHGLEAAYPDVMALFRPQLFSADLGLGKPDPRAFAAILDLLGTAPERTLFVDDAPSNTAAARALGLETHTFTDAAGLAAELARTGLP